MKKNILRFWIINILISISLFIFYRIVISETNHADGNFLEWILQILDIILNLAYSSIYLIAMALSSSAIFLNQIDKIRNNFYLSFFTFLGIPLICVIFIIVIVLTDGLLLNNNVTIFRNLLIFSVIYLFLTALQFLVFRKRINKVRSEGIKTTASS